MIEPELERHGLLQEQPTVLIFAAADQTPQHQEKIDDIGFGAGSAYLQIDVIQFKLAQLQLQFGQIRGLAGQELCIDQALQLFLFGVQIQILVDALHDRGLQASDLVNFVEKIVQLAVKRGQEH
jgi:hypothetical protein